MESHQPVMLPNPCAVDVSLKPNSDSVTRNTIDFPNSGRKKEFVVGNKDGFVGVLEIYIHQARDIHNICIYHKQDVYAKLSLTSDPETTVSTQIINGGGRNPIFNENLRLDVPNLDSSLKCEIWMLSRVRNYLEDQLLGFTLVPLSDVLLENGKLAQEFSLSSSDLFHSPAGFVELSLIYTGASPEILEIPQPYPSLAANGTGKDSEESPNSVPCELEKIEFPDPNIVNENEKMVSEYFGIPCTNLECQSEGYPNLDCQTSECFGTSKNFNHTISEANTHMLESPATVEHDNVVVPKVETPPSSGLTNGSPSASILTSCLSVSDTAGDSASPNQDVLPLVKEQKEEINRTENYLSDVPASSIGQPVISINVDPEPKLVQQDIVDMYNKSMQQFTEALAKMKLPLDIENGSNVSGNLGSDEKVMDSKENGPSPRVFYGSRAFF